MRFGEVGRHRIVCLALASCLILMGLLLVSASRNQGLVLPELTVERAKLGRGPEQKPVIELRGQGFDDSLSAILVKDAWEQEGRVSKLIAKEKVRALAVGKDLLVAAIDGTRLVTLRRDGKTFRLLGSIDLNAAISDIKLWGNYALVGVSREGIRMVDLSRVNEPRVERMIPCDGFIQEMLVDGNQLIFTDLYSGVFSIPLDRAEAVPARYGPDMPKSWQLASDGLFLAVATTNGRLLLLQQGGDTPGQLLASIDLKSNVMDMLFSGKRLVAITHDGSLYSWDLQGRPKLSKSHRLSLSGTPVRVVEGEDSDELIVSLMTAGLVKLRADSTGAYRQVGKLVSPDSYKLLRRDGELLFAAANEGLDFFHDARLPWDEVPGEVQISSQSQMLVLWQGQAYGYRNHELHPLTEPMGDTPAQKHVSTSHLVLAEGGQVDFFERKGEGTLTPVFSLQMPGKVASVVEIGDRLYVLVGNQLRVCSVSDDFQMRETAALQLPGHPWEMKSFAGGWLLVAANYGGLMVIDIRQPDTPLLMAQLQSVVHLSKYVKVVDLLTAPPYAFAALGLAGVELIDLTDPGQPRTLCRIDTPGYASSLTRAGDLLLVGDSQAGGFIIDIAEPASPRPVGSWRLPSKPQQVLAGNESLLIANSYGVFQSPLPLRLPQLKVSRGNQDAWMELPAQLNAKRQRLMLYGRDGQWASAIIQQEGNVSGQKL